jgi:hypothetical protein
MAKLSWLIASLVLLLSALPAAASICIEVDEDQDNLSQSDRSGALVLLRQVFIDEGQEIVDSGCDTTYTVFHVRLGQSVTVFMETGGETFNMQADSIEGLPDVYSQLVRTTLYGEVNATTRSNVTPDQDAPAREQADNLVYVRLGFGALFADGMASGPLFAVGDRFELDNIAIDASLNILILTDDSPTDGFNGNGRLAVLYYIDGMESASAYLGGGLTYGGTAICLEAGDCYTDEGLGIDAIAGYELLRASTIRFFFEINASFPFYDADYSSLLSAGAPGEESLWAPGFGITLGLGFGREQSGPIRIY